MPKSSSWSPESTGSSSTAPSSVDSPVAPPRATFISPDIRQPILKLSKVGCWTCKGRKIGCDRALPKCRNCLRTGRECLGYGIRLAWPEERPDGRRRKTEKTDKEQFFLELPDRTRRFVNVGFEEVAEAQGNGQGEDRAGKSTALVRQSLGRIERPRTYTHLGGGDETAMLSYYADVIAGMISTTSARNGFREELLPMALHATDSASQALRQGIMAVAALHRHGATAALPYKLRSVKQMSASLSDADGSSTTQLATAMMMCVYNVFDEAEGQWHIHINGARRILSRCNTTNPLSEFLWSWFLYHDVLGCFTQPASTPDTLPHGPADLDPEIIIGALGCSFEILSAIHRTNLLRCPFSQPARFAERQRIHLLLTTANQRLHARALVETPARQAQIAATAEFYRLAALLYLLRAAPQHQGDADERALVVNRALDVLGGMKRCTSPWPLFMVACEARDDEMRLRVLGILEGMGRERQIGNLLVMHGLVEGVWNRMDLSPSAREEPPWNLIQTENAAPWFI